MENKLTILILVRPFWLNYPKHKPKADMLKSIAFFSNVHYWYNDGDITDILNQLNIKPDFIFHYDIAWNYRLAPHITGLDKIDIPKGCFVIDLHWSPKSRIAYIEKNGMDLIFSVSYHGFLASFPQYEHKLNWLPWSINSEIIKDWQLDKSIDYLLMGLVHYKNSLPYVPDEGRYAFRKAVLEQMKEDRGFVYHSHPGHLAKPKPNVFMNEKYAQELNRAKIFFTCGGRGLGGGAPVLKFFEAPGCHTLLLAETNPDIQALGFTDQKHYISCTVDDVREKAAYYLEHDNEREKITDEGYRFIQENHSNEIRAQEFLHAVSTIL
ncbi:glycosyltransferase family protein [Paraliobacillus ryukyuensis]|uniref:glycosyltransferase family protein n=1 Tax=Paraliobacillus ryukyuensis TaxID=200904 RepID=UPI00117DF058|nr:glycosyltransferase [Paraliobacillus ryukyuensis]